MLKFGEGGVLLNLANCQECLFSTKVSQLNFEVSLIKTVVEAVSKQSIHGSICGEIFNTRKKSTQLLFWKKVFIVGTDFFLILILFYFSEELSRIEGQ